MKIGLASSNVFKAIYEQTRGRALTPETHVLDFGCGWGRIIRFFLKDIDPARLHGTDVFEEMVEHLDYVDEGTDRKESSTRTSSLRVRSRLDGSER